MIILRLFNFKGDNSGKLLQRKERLGGVIFAPKFRSSEIYVVTLILKKTIFITFKVFSGKISCEMERLRATTNQRFSLPLTMTGSGLRSSDNFCVSESRQYLASPKFKSCISHCKSWIVFYLVFILRQVCLFLMNRDKLPKG